MWIRSFLTNRKQTVDGVPSLPAPVKSGVPQGSVSGPILFLVLIGDIDQNVSSPSFVSSFADDTRVGRPVFSAIDCAALQFDLDTIYGWADLNNMMFNTDKFELLRYGQNQFLKDYIYVTQNGLPIQQKSVVRDLGVMMSDTGQFSDHINKVVLTASRMCAWILRTFEARDKVTMITLFKALVLPHLDYCSQLWSPAKISDIQKLENVQRSFIRKIDGSAGMDYWDRLKTYRLYSLERRRERYSIIYVWKMIEGLVPNIGIIHHDAGRRGRCCDIPPMMKSAPCWLKNLWENSFRVRGPMLFNCIPSCIRSMTGCDVQNFKHALDDWLKFIPDEPLVAGYQARRQATTNSIRHMVAVEAAGDGHFGGF